MIDIILFGILSSLIITIIAYMEASASNDDENTNRFFKIFFISFIVNMLAVFVFKNISNKSVYAEPVEVGFLD